MIHAGIAEVTIHKFTIQELAVTEVAAAKVAIGKTAIVKSGIIEGLVTTIEGVEGFVRVFVSGNDVVSFFRHYPPLSPQF